MLNTDLVLEYKGKKNAEHISIFEDIIEVPLDWLLS